MANIAVQGILYGTGAATLILSEGMFINTSTFDIPSSVRLPVSGGTYINCSKAGSKILNLTNPSSDSTFTFTCEWTTDETNWYQTDITGVLLHSLGTTDISFSLIGNTIGSSSRNLSELCASTLVNRYAQFCPNGLAPYLAGDFRKYAHSTPGGTKSRTDWRSNQSVGWSSSYRINAYGGRVFKEVTNRPYSSSKLQIRKGSTVMVESEIIDLNNTFGIFQFYTARNPYNVATDETWHIVVQHLYAGTWYDESDTSFTVSFLGDPYNFVRTAQSHVTDTLNITYTSSSPTRGYDVKLTVSGTNGGFVLQPNSGTPETISYVGAASLIDGSAWTIELNTIEAGWIQMLSGTIP